MGKVRSLKQEWRREVSLRGKLKPKFLGNGMSKRDRELKAGLLVRTKENRTYYLRQVISGSLINRAIIAHSLSNPKDKPFLHLTLSKLE
jgi:hypothetical protein